MADLETPLEDAAEQQQPASAAEAEEEEVGEDLMDVLPQSVHDHPPLEDVNEADAVEQHTPVPTEDEGYR